VFVSGQKPLITAGICGLSVPGKLSTNISRINERWQANSRIRGPIRGWFLGKTTNSVRTRTTLFRHCRYNTAKQSQKSPKLAKIYHQNLWDDVYQPFSVMSLS
jgi:hypothetical protein